MNSIWPNAAGHRRSRDTAAAAALIICAAVLVFGNTMQNTFALDDYYRVVDNPGIQTFWPPWHE